MLKKPLKEIRIEADISQCEMAKALGISNCQLNRIENGKATAQSYLLAIYRCLWRSKVPHNTLLGFCPASDTDMETGDEALFHLQKKFKLKATLPKDSVPLDRAGGPQGASHPPNFTVTPQTAT